jgi:chromate reductase, NAD(P)H dehydrogenase (quinone)
MAANELQPRVLVFAGSIRRDSYNRKLARAAVAALESAGAEATFADLKQYPMPFYDGDVETTQGMPQTAKAFKDMLRGHDAFVIASPEYNGSFPALLKNVIDWTSRPEPGEKPLAVYRGKTAAVLATSPGAGGGQRGLRQLRELLEMIGVNVVAQLAIPRATEAIESAGTLTRQEDRNALARLAEDLVAVISKARVAA